MSAHRDENSIQALIYDNTIGRLPGGALGKTFGGVVIAGLLVGTTCTYRVGEGMRAVELTGGQITSEVGPGWHLRVPVYQTVEQYHAGKLSEFLLKGLNIYYSPDTDTHTVGVPLTTDEVGAANAQQYTIHEIKVRATANPQHIKALHQRYQSDQAILDFVRDQVTETYKAVIRKIDPLKINVARDTVGETTRAAAQTRIDQITGIPGAIKLDSVIFMNFDFEKGVSAAFETANAARAGIQAETFAKQKAAIRVEREGLDGQAEGAKALAIARAQAQVIEVEGKALAANPMVLQQRWIEAWKGGAKVPMVIGDAAGRQFIFQLPSGLEGGPKQ